MPKEEVEITRESGSTTAEINAAIAYAEYRSHLLKKQQAKAAHELAHSAADIDALKRDLEVVSHRAEAASKRIGAASAYLHHSAVPEASLIYNVAVTGTLYWSVHRELKSTIRKVLFTPVAQQKAPVFPSWLVSRPYIGAMLRATQAFPPAVFGAARSLAFTIAMGVVLHEHIEHIRHRYEEHVLEARAGLLAWRVDMEKWTKKVLESVAPTPNGGRPH